MTLEDYQLISLIKKVYQVLRPTSGKCTSPHYARPCMHKLLPARHYKSLVLLAEIVSIIVSPVFTNETVKLLDQLLQEHHQLFRRVYMVSGL